MEAWRSGSLGAASPQASLLGFGGFCALSRSAGPSSPRAPQPPPSPKCASLVMEAWGTRVAVSWVQALAARLVPSLVSSLLVLGLVPGLVSSVIATLAPLRHASNLGGPFNLCSLLSAVSLGPPEGATTHDILRFSKKREYKNPVEGLDLLKASVHIYKNPLQFRL